MTQHFKIIFPLFFAISALFSCKKGEDEVLKGAKKLPCYITENMTLTNHNADGADYVAECTVEVASGTLTIEPGTTVEFPEGTYLWINNNAILRASGTSDKPILLKSTADGVYWDGILVTSASAQNQLIFTNITNGGLNLTLGDITTTFGEQGDKTRAAAVVCNGRLRMENCSVKNGRGDGVLLGHSAEILGFSNNIIENNNGYPLRTYMGLLSKLNLKSCTMTNNRDNFVALYSISSNEEVPDAVNIEGITVPYMAISMLDCKSGLELEAGTTMYFKTETALIAHGFITARGTAASPVVLRGLSSGAGAWGGVIAASNDIRNELAYCYVSDGGQFETLFAAPKANIVAYYDSRLKLVNCRSTAFDGCGVAVSNSANFGNQSPEISNDLICTF